MLSMQKEKKTALAITALIEERIDRRAKVIVMRNDDPNGWFAQVVAPGSPKLAQLQTQVDQITDTLRELYELEDYTNTLD
jgi:hypothetical protein